MNKSLSTLIILLIASSLSLLPTSALNPVFQGNYFFVSPDNHLSYELYQTRNGTIAHSIEPLDENNYVSRYALINLDTKDAIAILADLVDFCDIPNPTFQSLHYHAQTDSLVYYCAKNTSLLILNQQDHTVQETIPLNFQASSPPPVARLSTDGATTVAILLMDTLFIQSPQNSVLLKVDLQTKTVSTQVLFNQGLADNEAVVAYASNQNHAYIATNHIRGTYLITAVYPLVLTKNNTYQLTSIVSFRAAIISKIITKLFCLGEAVVVNDGSNLKFFDQQGSLLQSAKINTKPLNNQRNGFLHAAFTAQYDTYLYTLSEFGITIYIYSHGSVKFDQRAGLYGDFQVVFANPTKSGQDLFFVLNQEKAIFNIYDPQIGYIYKALSGYNDIYATDSTFAVTQFYQFTGQNTLGAHLFDMKTGVGRTSVPFNTISPSDHHYNMNQNILSYLFLSSGCVLRHLNLVSGKLMWVLSFPEEDPLCESSLVDARFTEKGNPEVVFRLNDHYVIISETYGRLTFPATSDTDSINVNFDNLSLYYLSADLRTNQITASLYAFNPLTKNFACISTNTLINRSVENQGFFTLNQSTIVALSSTSFAIINKLNSVYSQENFPNSYNMVTSFKDDSDAQFTFFAYSSSALAKGDGPLLFSSHSDAFVTIPGKRANTVNARATGPNSFCLHDDLHSIGVVRFYSADATTEKKVISI